MNPGVQSRSVKKIPNDIRITWLPPRKITVPEWVEQNVKLPIFTSAEPGPLRITRTPYTRGPLLALGSEFIEWVVLVWGRQLGKSQGVQYPFLCYCIAEDPGPTICLLPTIDKAKYTSRRRLQPMFDICEPVLQKKTVNPDDYTQTEMQFLDMVLSMVWGGSATQMTTRPSRYLFRDEVDELKSAVGENQIDPMTAIEQTTSNFSNRKIIDSSTPTDPNGNIWRELKLCQYVFEYWIPCPHCGELQILYWENVKFGDDHDPIVVEEMAYYECEACSKPFSNLDKIRMLARGEWRARKSKEACDEILKNVRAKREDTLLLDDILKNKRVKKIGFHLPKWYSPFSGGTFGVIAKEFLEANKALKDGDDFAPLRNWRMYSAARPWEQVAISETELELMKNEVDLAMLLCPKGTIALTAGIDPGQGGFWYSVLAWRADYGPHLVQSGWMPGDYETSEIESFVRTRVYNVDGEDRKLNLWRIGIDTGGGEVGGSEITMTAAAYEWIRAMKMRGLLGTKGLSTSMPKRLKMIRIDKMPGDKGVKIPGGLTLVEINTNAMKDLLWFKLNRNLFECQKCRKQTRFLLGDFQRQSPLVCRHCGSEMPTRTVEGLFTFHKDVEREFVQHLLAEENRMEVDGKWKWVKVRQANHLLDCCVIAFAMADSEFDGGIRVIQIPGITKTAEDKLAPKTKNWVKGWQ